MMPWAKATLFRGPALLTDADEDDEMEAGGLSDTTEDLADEENEAALASQDDAGDDIPDDVVDKKFKGDREAARRGYKELQAHASKLEQENAEFRRWKQEQEARLAALEQQRQAHHATQDQELPEVVMARQLADEVQAEVERLPQEKRNLRTTTEIMARKMLENARKITASQTSVVMSQEQAKIQAERDAAEALKAEGLDPNKYLRFMREQAELQGQHDPSWFQRTPAKEQFTELARRTKEYLRGLGLASKEEIDRANRERRQEADATMGGGSRTRSREPVDSRDEGEDDESMTAALRQDRRAAIARSRRLFAQRV